MARWRFLDLARKDERDRHARTLAAIDGWWTEFAENADSIVSLFRREREWDLPGWMSRTLQGIDDRIMWEYGPAVRGEGHRLAITPERRLFLRPLVDTIVERAPPIDGWEFYPGRLAEAFDELDANVNARTGGQASDLQFVADIDEVHRAVNLTFTGGTSRHGEPAATPDMFVATEVLLGEDMMNHWVGRIEYEREIAGQQPQPIEQLRETMRTCIDTVHSELPEGSIWRAVAADALGWSGIKGQPSVAKDYVALEDVIAATTALPEAVVTALRGLPFHSSRFTRGAETLCYLQLDRTDEWGFGDREALENALDQGLHSAELGGTFGGATGVRYMYVFIALENIDAAAKAMFERMRSVGVGQRSWLRFFDDELKQEWIGVDPEAPAPLMAPDEE